MLAYFLEKKIMGLFNLFNLFSKKSKTSGNTENKTLLKESYMPSNLQNDKELLFEKNSSYDMLKQNYRNGKIPKLNEGERSILEFCHNTDMKTFLKDEFEKHPIVLDEDGGLVKEKSYYK